MDGGPGVEVASAGAQDVGVVGPEVLDTLVDVLRRHGFRVIAPTVADGAIVYDEIASAEALPVGWTDVQEPGRYRLERRGDQARFGYAVGPHSWKQYLFPPRTRLWQARRAADGDGGPGGFEVAEDPPPAAPFAFIGVRSCELHAIAIQDKVFLGQRRERNASASPEASGSSSGGYTDRDYAGRRAGAFIVAVNCHEPGGTCFCVSMGTGPAVQGGYDLALSEILDGSHRLLVEAGSERGTEVLAELPHRPAEPADRDAARAAVDRAAARMGRAVQADGLRDLLAANLEHPRWDDVAQRCLTCGNCTMVCPTCFCSSVTDTTDLTGDNAERWRHWESCFTLEHSYVHSGSVRTSSRSRYRQWLTHKFGTWHDQFGTSGCVGCGRCITWCPVGIDVTEELAAIRLAPAGGDEDQ
jgi:ferredoxin